MGQCSIPPHLFGIVSLLLLICAINRCLAEICGVKDPELSAFPILSDDTQLWTDSQNKKRARRDTIKIDDWDRERNVELAVVFDQSMVEFYGSEQSAEDYLTNLLAVVKKLHIGLKKLLQSSYSFTGGTPL